ncbi:uncharacterized protein LOC129769932 [Toxorhynchites rutilus septentrionalis]|uniref:uncharacterized protein LOC129769932 n=1 Tax=Toxorhynchites rutilus septentrionalis TaxID=329112 RepID=UPI00247B0EBE|nr:uncharacterized protein LOC129769932 [Toxorhynchites rutilus septentrionalis]
MYKFVALFVALCGISVGFASPVRKSIVYYRQAYMTPQTMYGFHYQNQQLQDENPSTGIAAFAVGNTIAPGTYLKDCETKDVESAEQPAEDEQNVLSVAEALPESDIVPLEDETQSDVPTDSDQVADETNDDEPAAAPAISPVIPAVIPVAVPAKKKKVIVQSDSAEDDVPALPVGFFPINFGSTKGAVIAVANSYSTGKEGTAISTANAHGSPAAAELRRIAPVQLKQKPAKLRARKH